MHSPAYRVFEVPELVRLICSFVENPHLARLLTVSRCLFHCAAPLVWKEVSGVMKLLCLLPSLDLGDVAATDSEHLPLREPDRLARFSIYAPFIQKLKANAEEGTSCLCWELLLSNVPTRPLLPNLRDLDVNPSFKEQDSSRIVKYIGAFLCPTLSVVHTSQSYHLWINPLEARDLLVQMATTCPNLTKLNILVGNSQHPIHLLELGPYSPSSLFTPLSRFHRLRVLRSSSAVLYPDVLQLLGSLPHLESLTAYSHLEAYLLRSDNDNTEDDEIPIANLTLPEHSFPSLRNLEVDCVPGIVVSKLWQMPPLVQDLVSVRVHFMHDDDAEALSQLVCTVCQGSPHVTDLALDLVKSGGTELSSAASEHLSRLPLLRLRIWDCDLNVQPLIRALSNMEYLNIEWVYVDYEELALIAKHMPKLQYLHVGLLLSRWPDKADLPRDSQSPSPCYINSRFTFEDDFGGDTNSPSFRKAVMGIAQGLYALWPRGVYCAFEDPDHPELGEGDPSTLERLNEMIRVLSGTSALDVPSSEEFSSRWLYPSW
ncbi:hypothetical protein BDV93DRAFT_512188 [Ceratobasidium sp. AG-I]|nr:hypothetical protein BDV93DRAFT_512188 [Ceratobasidium sp. AG-I]